MCAVVQVCTGQRQEGRASPGLNSESSIKPGKPRAARWGEGLTLVAEEAAPALLAVTLPRLLTGAVETAWVPDALVTVPALPAHSALAFPWLVTKPMLLITSWQADCCKQREHKGSSPTPSGSPTSQGWLPHVGETNLCSSTGKPSRVHLHLRSTEGAAQKLWTQPRDEHSS